MTQAKVLEVQYLLRSSITTSLLKQLLLYVNASLLPQLFAEKEREGEDCTLAQREIENEELVESE